MAPAELRQALYLVRACWFDDSCDHCSKGAPSGHRKGRGIAWWLLFSLLALQLVRLSKTFP
jgi:hypothetical protein